MDESKEGGHASFFDPGGKISRITGAGRSANLVRLPEPDQMRRWCPGVRTNRMIMIQKFD
jgi:hypothetical protein